MAELINELSWSKSRHEKLAECRRLYYFHYYGAWGGWKVGAPEKVRELYLLKKLSNRFQWAGNAVHEAIRAALSLARAGEPPPFERLAEQMRQKMREEFKASRARRYRERGVKALGLVEHEYGEPVSDEEWKRNWDNAQVSLKSFYEGPYLARARTLGRDQWLSIDELDSFLLEGIKVFAAPDFAYREDGGRTTVIDWKTGKPRGGEDEQVQGYVLYAKSKWGVDPAKVTAKLVYLGSGEEREVTVDEPALARFQAHFRESMAKMRALLADPDANRPLEIDRFPLTDDRRLCTGCAFRRVCER